MRKPRVLIISLSSNNITLPLVRHHLYHHPRPIDIVPMSRNNLVALSVSSIGAPVVSFIFLPFLIAFHCFLGACDYNLRRCYSALSSGSPGPCSFLPPFRVSHLTLTSLVDSSPFSCFIRPLRHMPHKLRLRNISTRSALGTDDLYIKARVWTQFRCGFPAAFRDC